jgi:hypothetical protein
LIFLNSKNLLKLSTFIATVASLLSLTCIALGAYYSFPNAETIGLTGEIKNGNLLSAISNLLMYYDGRYFTNLLHGLNPLAWGWFNGYKLMPLFGFSLFFISTSFFFSSLFLVKFRKLFVLIFLFTAVHFSLSPSLVSELYNLIGSYVYLYGVCLWMLWLASLYKYLNSNSPLVKNGWFFLTFILLIASTGTNEQILLLNALTIGYILSLIIFYRKALLIDYLPILLTGAISILFFLSCPGWKIRALYVEKEFHPASVNEAIIQSLQQYFSYFFEAIVSSGGIILMLALFISMFLELKHIRYKKTIIYFALFILISSYLITLPYYLTMGNESVFPNRIYTPVYTLIQLSILLLFVSTFKHNIFSYNNKDLLMFSISAIMFLLITFTNNNYRTMWQEYRSGEYEVFTEKFEDRLTKIKLAQQADSKWKKVCIDEDYTNNSIIYYNVSIKENRGFEGANFAYEKYFNLNEVILCDDVVDKSALLKKMLNE